MWRKGIDKLAFGNYNKKIVEAATAFDWLCTDEKEVQKYLDEPMCGFTFTLNGFRTLFTLLDRLNKDENLKEMPKDLPVLFIAGTDDPVGNYGEGVRKAQEDFKRVGMKRTSLKLYEGCRHEILNEPIKQQIFDDIYAWVMERVEEY